MIYRIFKLTCVRDHTYACVRVYTWGSGTPTASQHPGPWISGSTLYQLCRPVTPPFNVWIIACMAIIDICDKYRLQLTQCYVSRLPGNPPRGEVGECWCLPPSLPALLLFCLVPGCCFFYVLFFSSSRTILLPILSRNVLFSSSRNRRFLLYIMTLVFTFCSC